MQDGRMFCWGDNASGQLGISSGQVATVPTQPAKTDVLWSAISVGAEHTCALTGGRAYCWGLNAEGQVTGAASVEPVTVPTEVMFAAPPPALDQIAAGGHQTCAIGIDGTLWCWGKPNRLGIGQDPPPPNAAVQVPGTGWARVAASGTHTCGIQGPAAMCWSEDNNLGEDGSGSDTPVYAPNPVVGLPPGPSRIAVGETVSCAIVGMPQGELWCWGNDDVDQLNDMAGNRSNTAVQIGVATDWEEIEVGGYYTASGMPHQLVCGEHGGTWRCWGCTTAGPVGNAVWDHCPVSPSEAVDVGAADAIILGLAEVTATQADEVGCALRSGEVACWGENRFGELGMAARN
jgi:alpha-tubulin suppressor-like RCC1 family protein